ncbi:hypothetical protein VOLCADRAFT_96136 [Volvox carteri f. nagariensis]|uniref:SAM domain-containing protein n=1 Tax=Volvox carteri f. nagariensis TaxID=3068 RepID=D8U9B0_VOLCA|nr:uncharacterized protein VOLCADRAFT_96136 [Volvox carteri f. nagariensis]EFJ43722.1 hypothetical protein VOLCADRAFT_96136 [Volvox carteri f. nagariensis]|eukprot:XP_002955203.1 hypothetical protein VOLCADRAFT_96136 [Volvox carteri f. nagariensis]
MSFSKYVHQSGRVPVRLRQAHNLLAAARFVRLLSPSDVRPVSERQEIQTRVAPQRWSSGFGPGGAMRPCRVAVCCSGHHGCSNLKLRNARLRNATAAAVTVSDTATGREAHVNACLDGAAGRAVAGASPAGGRQGGGHGGDAGGGGTAAAALAAAAMARKTDLRPRGMFPDGAPLCPGGQGGRGAVGIAPPEAVVDLGPRGQRGENGDGGGGGTGGIGGKAEGPGCGGTGWRLESTAPAVEVELLESDEEDELEEKRELTPSVGAAAAAHAVEGMPGLKGHVGSAWTPGTGGGGEIAGVAAAGEQGNATAGRSGGGGGGGEMAVVLGVETEAEVGPMDEDVSAAAVAATAHDENQDGDDRWPLLTQVPPEMALPYHGHGAARLRTGGVSQYAEGHSTGCCPAQKAADCGGRQARAEGGPDGGRRSWVWEAAAAATLDAPGLGSVPETELGDNGGCDGDCDDGGGAGGGGYAQQDDALAEFAACFGEDVDAEGWGDGHIHDGDDAGDGDGQLPPQGGEDELEVDGDDFVAAWLCRHGLQRWLPRFRDGEVDEAVVPELNDTDLQGLGIDSPRARAAILVAARDFVVASGPAAPIDPPQAVGAVDPSAAPGPPAGAGAAPLPRGGPAPPPPGHRMLGPQPRQLLIPPAAGAGAAGGGWGPAGNAQLQQGAGGIAPRPRPAVGPGQPFAAMFLARPAGPVRITSFFRAPGAAGDPGGGVGTPPGGPGAAVPTAAVARGTGWGGRAAGQQQQQPQQRHHSAVVLAGGQVSLPREQPLPPPQQQQQPVLAAGGARPSGRLPRWVPECHTLPGTRILVDFFGPSSKSITAAVSPFRILTHFHADHYKAPKEKPRLHNVQHSAIRTEITVFRKPSPHRIPYLKGLTRSFAGGTVLASPVTARLVSERLKLPAARLRTLPMDTPVEVDGVCLTLVDANHCPGAAMVVAQPPGGWPPVLHTGDCRLGDHMRNHPAMQLLVGRRCTLVLDTTYCDPQYEFPPQRAVLDAVLEAVKAESFNKRALFVFGTYTIGKERLFLEVAAAMGQKVYCSKEKAATLAACGLAPRYASLITTNHLEANIHAQYRGRYSAVIGFSGSTAGPIQPDGTTREVHEEEEGEEVPAAVEGEAVSAGGGVLAAGALPRCYPGSSRAPLSGGGWPVGPLCCTRWGPVLLLRGFQPTFPKYREPVPYSEHSSFGELRSFVSWLQPGRIVPSVNADGPAGPRTRRMLQLLLGTAEEQAPTGAAAAAAAAAGGSSGASGARRDIRSFMKGSGAT